MRWRLHGLRAWLWQRVTAVYMAVFLAVALPYLFSHSPMDYEQWFSLITQPAVDIALILFFVSLLLHAWVGLRDVIIDYIQPWGLRLLCLCGVGLALAGMLLWSLRILWI